MSEITLEFDTNNDETTQNSINNTEIVDNKNDFEVLSDKEKKLVQDFVTKIDLADTVNITSYGKSSQSKISDFSIEILNEVKLKDTGEIGKTLSQLIVEVNSIEDDDEPKGIFKLFKKAKDDINVMIKNFSDAEVTIEEIANSLDLQKVELLKDIETLDNMYENNKNYFKELSLYILAGEEKLKQYYEIDIENQKKIVEQNNSQLEIQNLNDMVEQANRFDKRLHDLKLTKTISLQMAPQIKMLQNNNIMLVEKIDSSILNTIPLWRNQMVLAIGINHNKKALELQSSVNDATNEILKRNSQMLKQSTIDVAKENERGIVDIETLKETNKNLIDTIGEVLKIQKDGATNRHNAEKELIQIENELKQALLSVANSN